MKFVVIRLISFGSVFRSECLKPLNSYCLSDEFRYQVFCSASHLATFSLGQIA